MIDVLVEAVDDCLTRIKKSGWRGLNAQDRLIFVGAILLFVAVAIVAIGLLLI